MRVSLCQDCQDQVVDLSCGHGTRDEHLGVKEPPVRPVVDRDKALGSPAPPSKNEVIEAPSSASLYTASPREIAGLPRHARHSAT